MLLFCPTCANVLTVEEGSGPTSYRFACQTCPYVYNISKKVSSTITNLFNCSQLFRCYKCLKIVNKQVFQSNVTMCKNETDTFWEWEWLMASCWVPDSQPNFSYYYFHYLRFRWTSYLASAKLLSDNHWHHYIYLFFLI